MLGYRVKWVVRSSTTDCTVMTSGIRNRQKRANHSLFFLAWLLVVVTRSPRWCRKHCSQTL